MDQALGERATTRTPQSAITNGTSTKAVVSQLKKRKQRRRVVLVVVLVAIVAIASLFIVMAGREKPILVQTEKVSRRTITETVQATGTIQPQVAVKVTPEVPGEVVQLPIKEGAHVKKGDMLAKIKPNTYQDQLAQAEATLNSTKARSLQAKASRINAKQEYDRGKRLKQQGLLSDQDLQALEAKYEVAIATEKAANFDVASSASIVRQYSEALTKTTVYAPMDGVVTSLITQLGEKVVGTSQFAGTEMMTVSDLSWMNAEVDVDENDVVNIAIGDTARVSIDAFPNRTFVGIVIEVANSAKLKGNGTQDQSTDFKVKVKLLDFSDADLRPGMSCTAKIETQTKKDVMSVPINAIARRESADTVKPSDASNSKGVAIEIPLVVFVVGKDNRVRQVAVKTGISDNAYVEIVSGLKGDEEVVKGNYAAVSKELQDKKLIKIDNSASKQPDASTKSS